MDIVRHPRAHAWESPRSTAQRWTLLLVIYVAAVWVVCTVPALSDIVRFGFSKRTEQWAAALLHWSPAAGLLAVVVLVCYLVVSFKDVGSGKPLLETDADIDCGPICGHCNEFLPPETRDVEIVTDITCDCCGAIAHGAEKDIVGLWAYGLHGVGELAILPHESGNYEIVEGGFYRTLLSRVSAETAEDKEAIYEAEWWADKQKIRIIMLGHNALRITSLPTCGPSNWQHFAVARRKAGGGLLGEWSMPAWDHSVHEPDCWECFEVTKMPGIQAAAGMITGGQRQGARSYGLAIRVQASPGPQEVATGLLRPGLPEESEGEEADCISQQILVAQLRTEQERKPCGWVKLEVDSDHLIYQYRPEESDYNTWGPRCVALRGGSVSFACCERCGLASHPPWISSAPRLGHCNYCNKCIPGFDHHCIFLNQCVGQRNYKEWLLLVVSLLILGVAALLGSSLVLFASHCRIFSEACHPPSFQSLQHSWRWTCAEVVALMGSVMLDVFLFQLVVFHFRLAFTKRTTKEVIFQTTADEAYERRRAKHLWRLCQLVARRRGLELPPPKAPPALSLPGTPNAFARNSPLSQSLPGTPNAFARPPSLSLSETPKASAAGKSSSLESISPTHQSETFSPRRAWRSPSQQSVDAAAARAICAGTNLESADEDYSEPFLELQRGNSSVLDLSPTRTRSPSLSPSHTRHASSLSSPFLQHDA